MATTRATSKKTVPAPAPAGQPKPASTSRRTAILQAATRRFAKAGFEATTVRQLADDVKMLSGSLYHHFATKEDMLHEIVREPVQQMRDNIERVSKARLDAEHRLVALLLLDLGELTRNQEVHAILFNERKFFRSRPDFAYVVQAKLDAYQAWERVLKDGVKAKLFKPDIEMFLTISTIVRTLNSAADWYHSEEILPEIKADGNLLERYIDFHIKLIVNAVRLPSRAAKPIPRQACEAHARFQN